MSRNEAIILLNQHLDYLNHVEDYLDGKLGDPGEKAHTDCALGKWYYGEATSDPHLTAHPHYASLGEAHQKFHATAHEIIALFKAGKVEEAKAKVSEIYSFYTRISNILMELDDVLQQEE